MGVRYFQFYWGPQWGVGMVDMVDMVDSVNLTLLTLMIIFVDTGEW